MHQEIETPTVQSPRDELEHTGHHRIHSISISMPPSPIQAHMENKRKVLFERLPDSNGGVKSASCELPKPAKFQSQPIQTRPAAFQQEINTGISAPNPGIRRTIDRRFDSFKTWSGKLERQITNLRGKPQRETRPDDVVLQNSDVDTLPVDRYFDALEGPELDTVRVNFASVIWFLCHLLF